VTYKLNEISDLFLEAHKLEALRIGPNDGDGNDEVQNAPET